MAKDEITPMRCKIILTLADCNMRANAAAKKLYMDASSVLYHIKIIKAITGKDPRKFYELLELLKMVKEEYGDYYDLQL